ncbi:MAG: preprotein translocase subunit SecA [Clostridia bacterium]|jgi:preprotein translocase subunit SecA|nr:preprotein translocase subunit SecA [Clostridia bacterium]
MNFMKLLFGNYSKRELKRIQPIVDAVLSREKQYMNMADEELKAQTHVLKERIKNGETLDNILPDAFATCREAADRALGKRHYPVQIIGGIVLHQGRVAEMRTGEGKTLVLTLPTYLNALTGKGVHVVTVNDYLAKRDSDLMSKVYSFLGLTTGFVGHDMSNDQRRKAYAKDITYATNNELGFDYLRDNMVQRKEDRVQRGHYFAIVDEVDSILIDEARTPLIISGEGDKSTELYAVADRFVRGLRMTKVKEVDAKEDNDELYKNTDYVVDEKAKNATLTPEGIKKAEEYFHLNNLMDPENLTIQHHINQALKAYGVMTADIDYVVRGKEVLIVDEFTGRIMQGRRYNEGLHQAIEAKEGVEIQKESKTLASITFQNYFRLYDKLSGTSGTVVTEEDEFREIYKLDIVEIPPNRPVKRIDESDLVYKTERGKFRAVIKEVKEAHKTGQPILIGTAAIDKSEILSHLLSEEGLEHQVLNAKHHEKEAEIVAQAGKKGAITIATNMAGRGTDIMLGGNSEFMAKAELKRIGLSPEQIIEATNVDLTDDPEIIKLRQKYRELLDKFAEDIKSDAEEVRQAGGLYIIGTERHESRRIDNQLRGRAGRQGDPGRSRFYLSLEDDLIRIFGGDRMSAIMSRFNIDEDTPLEAKMLTRSIENAQKKIEMRNFASRKSVLQYDDVLSKQRDIIYAQRNAVLDGEDVHSKILGMIKSSVKKVVARYLALEPNKEKWNLEGLRDYYLNWALDKDSLVFDEDELKKQTIETISDFITKKCEEKFGFLVDDYTEESIKNLERSVLLQVVDKHWMDHMDAMEELKRGIGLRAYAQKDPIIDYRVEGFDMFEAMVDDIKEETVKSILSFQNNGNSGNMLEDDFDNVESFMDQFNQKVAENHSTIMGG